MKVLIATDGSWHSSAALRYLLSVPLPAEVEAKLVTVIEDFGLPSLAASRPGALAELQQTIRQRTQRRLGADLSLLSQTSWRIRSEIREGHAADELLEAIQDYQPHLTVVGSRGLTGFEGYLLGRVSYRVATNSPSSVLIVKPCHLTGTTPEEPVHAVRKILLALDGSRGAWQALESLACLPLKGDTEVTILTVMTLVTHYRMDILLRLSDFWQEEKKAAQERLAEAATQLHSVRPRCELKEGEDAAQEIVAYAREMEPDLLVMGHKGMSSIEKFLLGSVSSKVIHHAPCSVLLVKGKGLAS